MISECVLLHFGEPESYEAILKQCVLRGGGVPVCTDLAPLVKTKTECSKIQGLLG